MKIAIMYTGELRTVEKTIDLFKKNVLLNDDVHIFATVQSTNDYNNFLKTNFGNNLKILNWFNPNDAVWNNLKNILLKQLQLEDHLKNYISSSDSMIEYYQLYLAYQDMCEFEEDNNIKYDYVVRCRPDCIVTQPLDFSWLNMSVDDVKEKMNTIMNMRIGNTLPYSQVNIELFMNSLLDPSRIYYAKHLYGDTILSQSDTELLMKDFIINDTSIDEFYIRFHKYITTGKYILTFRKNLFYIINRDYIEPIANIGISYGMVSYKHDTGEWWNAEAQIYNICKVNNISKYDSTYLLEDKSLYEYNEDNYFNKDNTLKITQCVVFIRKS